MRSHIFVKQMARLADIPPIGDGRYAWYGEQAGNGRRSALLQRARVLSSILRATEPRVARRHRLRRKVQRVGPSDLRFHEWFAADDAQARATTLGDLMSSGDGLLNGLPRNLSIRFRGHEDYPLRFIEPLALLAAAYLAEVCRNGPNTERPRDQS
jgi:hypothetical protein